MIALLEGLKYRYLFCFSNRWELLIPAGSDQLHLYPFSWLHSFAPLG